MTDRLARLACAALLAAAVATGGWLIAEERETQYVCAQR